VDNAVVVTESIFRHRQMNGSDPIASTLSGVSEVGLAVLAGTLSTIIVFLPIVFGEESQISVFMVHVAVPIVIAMVASLFVAQTIIPTLTARFPAPPAIKAGSRYARVQDWYLRALNWLFHHKWKGALFVLLTVLSPIPLFATGMLKVDMFPQDAFDQLHLPYHIEGTYPLARTEEAVTRVETYLEENKERFGIDLVYSYYTPDDASSVIRLKPRDEMPRPLAPLVIVPVAPGAVRMTVRELFLRRVAHVDDLDLERQRLARERVVQVEVDVEVSHLPHARLPAAFARVDDDHLPLLNRPLRREVLQRHALHGVLVTLAVTLLGRHGGRELFAALFAVELRL
jgi:HAE1 family hydrophobic/amphiphilic exporter-1